MDYLRKAKFIALIFLGVAFSLGAIFISFKINTERSKTKAEEIQISNFENTSNDPLSLLSASVLQVYRTASLQKTEKRDKLTLSKKSSGVYQKEYVYISRVISPKITFNAVGPHWIGSFPQGTRMDLEIRIKDNKGKWTEWRKVEKSEVGKPENENFGRLIFVESGKSIQYKVKLETSDLKVSPSLENLKFTFIDSTRGPKVRRISFLNRLFKRSWAAGRPRIISRREWGCDESLRYWEPEYYPVTALVLHHTAGYDGGSNPAAVVRGIYYYHTVTRGWGDIGYNFLVDKYGNIYQGRYGGEGVIGAHAYDEIKKINYNKGSIGISVLGSYGSHGISYKAKQAIASLTASLLYDFNLDPTKRSILQGKKIPTLCAHRDLEPTYCPGDKFYLQISSIRTLAKSIQNSFGAKIYKGKIVRKIRKGSRIYLSVKNLSNFVWHNYTKNAVRIVSNKKQIARMKEPNVLPGKIAHFSFNSRNKSFSVMIGRKEIGGGNVGIASSMPRAKSALFSKTNTLVLDFDKSLNNLWIRKSQFQVKVGSKIYPILKLKKKGKRLTITLAEHIGYKLTPKVIYTFSKTKTITAKNVIKDSPDLINFAVSKRNFSNKIKIFNREGKLISSFWAYRPEFKLGTSVTLGDINGDGNSEIITGAGKTGGPHIRIFDKKGRYLKWSVFAFDRNFRGGIEVASGDADGDGVDEIGVCQAQSGQAWCKVYKANKQKTILFEKNVFGQPECGASIALGDVDGDGKDEIIVGSGPGKRNAEIKVFDLSGNEKPIVLHPFDSNFTGGLDVTSGDVDGDGKDEIGVCQKSQGEAWCKIYKYNFSQTILGEWRAYPQGIECGASIDLLDLDGNGKDEVITSPGPGYLPQIKAFSPSGRALKYGFRGFERKFREGLDVTCNTF